MNLAERMERVTQRRAKARAEAPDITCILLGPRFEQELKELSVELPSYDWACSGVTIHLSGRLH